MRRSDEHKKAAPSSAAGDKRSLKEKDCRISFVKALNSALIFIGLSAAVVFPGGVFAQVDVPVASAAKPYDIPSGSLEAALNQFEKQAGIEVSFNAAEVKGATVSELKGSFTPQAGLDRLLAGSGLEAVPQTGGY